MKNKNKVLLYSSVALLFLSTFQLSGSIIKGFKSNSYEFYQIGAYFLILVFAIFQILKRAKIENNKNS